VFVCLRVEWRVSAPTLLPGKRSYRLNKNERILVDVCQSVCVLMRVCERLRES